MAIIKRSTYGNSYLHAYELSQGGGERPEIDVLAKTITENGVYNAGVGKAYNPVTVNIDLDLEEKTIEENGTYVSADHNGFSKVVVDVEPELEERVVTENNKVVTPSEGKDAMSKVTVAIPEEEATYTVNGTYYPTTGKVLKKVVVDINDAPELESLTATQNGTYNPSADKDGFNQVVVKVKNELEDATYTTNGIKQVVKHDDVIGLDKVTIKVPNEVEATTITRSGQYTYNPVDMKIGWNSVKVDIPYEDKTVTENGTVLPTSPYEAMSSVVVNVPNQTEAKTITEEGTYEYEPHGNYVGWNKIIVDVPEPSLEDKTITANGTYSHSEGFDGLGTVTVNVPSSVSGTKVINENGTYDVETFKTAEVNVQVQTEEKTIEENGVYTPSTGKYFSKVTVNTPVAPKTYTGTTEPSASLGNDGDFYFKEG